MLLAIKNTNLQDAVFDDATVVRSGHKYSLVLISPGSVYSRLVFLSNYALDMTTGKLVKDKGDEDRQSVKEFMDSYLISLTDTLRK